MTNDYVSRDPVSWCLVWRYVSKYQPLAGDIKKSGRRRLRFCIGWKDHRTNTPVLKQIATKSELLNIVKKVPVFWTRDRSRRMDAPRSNFSSLRSPRRAPLPLWRLCGSLRSLFRSLRLHSLRPKADLKDANPGPSLYQNVCNEIISTLGQHFLLIRHYLKCAHSTPCCSCIGLQRRSVSHVFCQNSSLSHTLCVCVCVCVPFSATLF